MTPPRSYAEWLPLIERFAEGDDAVIEQMSGGSIEWTNVVAERWTARLSAAFTTRLKTLSSQLQLALDRASGDPFAISQAMLAARRGLQPLTRVAGLGCIPEDVRKHLGSELERFASQTQETLEKSAQRIRTDGGALLKAIRDNTLRAAAPAAPTPQPDQSASPGRRPRVLL